MGGAQEKTQLPPRLHLKHGAYWYVCQIDKRQVWQSLGSSETEAVRQAILLNSLKATERMRALAAVYKVEAKMRVDVLLRDEYRCVYCGSTENLGIDHVIPFAAGGATAPFNLVACCLSCNSSKGDKGVREFIACVPELRTALLEKALKLLDETTFIRHFGNLPRVSP